jgi:hypothetical protein
MKTSAVEVLPPLPGAKRATALAVAGSVLARNNPYDTLVTRIKSGIDAAGRFEKCKLACQVITGFDLIELRKLHGRTEGGRPETSKRLGGFQPWDDFVKGEFGISDETARTWMKMAEKAKPRLKKLGLGNAKGLAQLLEKSPSQMNAEETGILTSAVTRLTDGLTQLDFMRDLGLLPKIPKLGGARPKGKKPTPEEQLAQDIALAQQNWADVCEAVNGFFEDEHHLHLTQDLRDQMDAVFEGALEKLNAVED